jgi:signal transduction histidine kinase
VGEISDAWAAVRGRPWRFLASSWPWRSLAYVTTAVPAGLACLIALTVILGVGLLTLPIVVGLFLLTGVPRLATVVAAGERRRLRLVLPQSGAERGATLRDRLQAGHQAAVAWPEIGYAVLLSTIIWLVDATVLVFAVAVPAVLLLAPVLVRQDHVELIGWRIDHTGEAAFAAAGVGPVSVVLSAYILTWLASGQAALARQLLDPPEARLAAAVAQLRRSRTELVDAFEAERRRIERDLHDGVQQRLVALTMTLGSAELDVPEGSGLELVRQAHRQAESALEELRSTVRGIHPRVLADHGLAAAVHEIADRSPVPVHTDITLPGRLPAPVENAAYFVVSEALTNVARHAKASFAQVHAWAQDGTLVLTVVDDGVGGADPAKGSGLAGLASRLDALDGEVRVTSPPGGPTEVRMQCPIDAV